MLFHGLTKGWYSDDRIDAPEGCVFVTLETRDEMLAGEAAGKIIEADENGFPVLVSPSQTVGVPISASAVSVKLALLDAGFLDDIEAYLDELIGDDKRRAAICWQSSGRIRRDDLFLNDAATAKGITTADLDQVFITAVRS